MRLPNMQAFTSVGAILIALLTTSCQDPAIPDSKVPAPPAATADQVPPPGFVGTPPEGPTKDMAANSSGSKSDISKSQQSNDMPLPGQANDHSTLSPSASQKTTAKSGTP